MDDALVTGQYGPWRTVWFAGGFALLLLVAGVKLAVVDREPAIALYPAVAALVAVGIALVLRRSAGRFRITRTAITAQQRVGTQSEVAIAEIRSVYFGTMKLPRLRIEHSGGTLDLPSISGRHKAIAALRTLGVGPS